MLLGAILLLAAAAIDVGGPADPSQRARMTANDAAPPPLITDRPGRSVAAAPLPVPAPGR